MCEFLFDVLLILSRLLSPLSVLLFSSIFRPHQIVYLLLKFLLVFVEETTNLFDCFSSCLNFVVFMHSVNGALGADGTITAEAKVG